MSIKAPNLKEFQRTNKPGFLKDPRTNFVHNTNWDHLKAYQTARAQFLESADLKIKNLQVNKELQALKELLKAKGILD